MKLIISLLIVSLLAFRTLRLVNTQELQIYPAETIDGTTPLYFGLMQSFGVGFNSSGVIGGVEVALDQINSDSTMLPGYTLHYTLMDSQVRELAVDIIIVYGCRYMYSYIPRPYLLYTFSRTRGL